MPERPRRTKNDIAILDPKRGRGTKESASGGRENVITLCAAKLPGCKGEATKGSPFCVKCKCIKPECVSKRGKFNACDKHYEEMRPRPPKRSSVRTGDDPS